MLGNLFPFFGKKLHNQSICSRSKKYLILREVFQPDSVQRIDQRTQGAVVSFRNLQLFHFEKRHPCITSFLKFQQLIRAIHKEISRKNPFYHPETVFSQTIPDYGCTAICKCTEIIVFFGLPRINPSAEYISEAIM